MEVMKDGLKLRSRWIIERYKGEVTSEDIASGKVKPFKVSHIEGNCGLNEGIAELLLLITGTGSPTAWNNANARLGVGDSDAEANATQTGLQAAVNKLWKSMDPTYPQVSAQTGYWQATFGTSEANYDWKEFTIVNASTDAGKNLNRKADSQGTKTDAETWTLRFQVTVA
jgi:hypothetical protein